MKRVALLLLVMASIFVFAGLTAQHRVHAAEGQVHEADDLLARKQRSIDWKNQLIAEKTKEVHRRDAEINERDRILGSKQRTLEYKDKLIKDKTALLHKNDEKMEEAYRVVGSQERTIEWKNQVIREKTQQLQAKEEELAARSDMLARKQRTLEWKQDLIREKVADAQKRKQDLRSVRKQLFETQHIHHLSENQLHAKLIKVLATLQSHLTRHSRQEHVVQAAREHLKQAVGEHAKTMKELIPNDKTGKLEAATVKLHNTVHEVISFATEQIVEDNDQAEARLKKLTQQVLDELQSEIADEKAMLQKEQEQADADAEYAAMLEEARKNDEPSVDESNVKKMIEEYKTTVDSIRSPTGMTQDDVDKGYKTIDSIREGALSFHEGQAQMTAAMKAHSYVIPEDQTDLIATFEQFLSEGEFMVQHAGIRDKLDKWQAGSMSNAEIMLEIEKVSPGMLSSMDSTKAG